jgi:hypothetical protein
MRAWPSRDLLVDLGMDRADIARMCRERLLAGQATYGALRLATDKRMLVNEAVFELLDLLNYAGMDTVQAEERGRWRRTVAAVAGTSASPPASRRARTSAAAPGGSARTTRSAARLRASGARQTASPLDDPHRLALPR